jgi:uncharacterized protein (DUF2235 family)
MPADAAIAADPARTEVNVKEPGPPKRLVVCFDGTWNRLDARCPTNVVLTAESVVPMAPDKKAQVIFYDEGVGTGHSDHLGGGVFGWGVTDKLGDAYRFLTFNYTPGDEIFVFGFSRGAFTARSFVGLLHNCGIVARSKARRIGDAIDWYERRSASTLPASVESREFRAEISPAVCADEGEDAWRQGNVANYVAGSAPFLNVAYLGVWDTVGSLGIPTRYRLLNFLDRKYRFHDTALASIVRSGRHAVAIDERRKDFTPTLWSNIDDLNRTAGATPDDPAAPYLEHWFPGVHCAVGGGGDFRGLSDQALVWIWEGALKAGLALDTTPGSPPFAVAPDPRDPLWPFDKDRMSWWHRRKSALINALWQKGDRTGPTDFANVAVPARRRWQYDPAALPEKIRYRPKPLHHLRKQLDASPPPPPPPKVGTFDIVRVAPNDSLTKIALQRLGNGDRWKEIFDMNQDLLDDPNHIYPGMPLRVPKR